MSLYSFLQANEWKSYVRSYNPYTINSKYHIIFLTSVNTKCQKEFPERISESYYQLNFR